MRSGILLLCLLSSLSSPSGALFGWFSGGTGNSSNDRATSIAYYAEDGEIDRGKSERRPEARTSPQPAVLGARD